YQASSVPQPMHAERGLTTERRSGTRTARTFRKLPTASPGARAKAASAAFTLVLSAGCGCELNQPEKLCGGVGWAWTGLFVGAPPGATPVAGEGVGGGVLCGTGVCA